MVKGTEFGNCTLIIIWCNGPKLSYNSNKDHANSFCELQKNDSVKLLLNDCIMDYGIRKLCMDKYVWTREWFYSSRA